MFITQFLEKVLPMITKAIRWDGWLQSATVLLVAGSLNLSEIVRAQEEAVWFVIPLFPMAVIFFISTLAETNRHPFDMPEAEAELVSGYNVEYSAMTLLLVKVTPGFE